MLVGDTNVMEIKHSWTRATKEEALGQAPQGFFHVSGRHGRTVSTAKCQSSSLSPVAGATLAAWTYTR